MPQKQADAPLRPCPSADITQSFYNNMSPRSQSLVVIASTLALSLVFIFAALTLTEEITVKQPTSTSPLANNNLTEAELTARQVQAFKNAEAAAAKGDAEKIFAFANFHLLGLGTPQNEAEGVRTMKRAADLGYAPAQFFYASALQNGFCVIKDPAAAIPWFHKAAAQGDADAENSLATAYAEGDGVKINKDTADKWLRLAADHGQFDACAEMADRFMRQKKPSLHKQALKLLHPGAEACHSRSCHLVSVCYYLGIGVEKDLTESIAWALLSYDENTSHNNIMIKNDYEKLSSEEKKQVESRALKLAGKHPYKSPFGHDPAKLAEDDKKFAATKIRALQGDASSQYRLAEFYHQGLGTKEDHVAAVEWYRKAAEQGLRQAQRKLGTALIFSDGVAGDEKQGFAWCMKAALQGDDAAEYTLAQCYAKGLGVDSDSSQAKKWNKIAAEHGHAAAQWDEGCQLWEQDPNPIKDPIALKWFQKSADQLFPPAAISVGICHLYGRGVETDKIEGYAWMLICMEDYTDNDKTTVATLLRDMSEKEYDYAKSRSEKILTEMMDFNETKVRAEKGDPIAQYHLAKLYVFGRGTKKDEAEAARWCRKSAEQGYATAQFALAQTLRSGQAGKTDPQEAFSWYMKAALQGYPAAEYQLSVFYELGDRVNTDKDEAAKWRHKAAEHGEPYAQCGIGNKYFGDKADPVNDALAAGWFRKSAEQLHPKGGFFLGLCYMSGRGVPLDKVEGLAWMFTSSEGLAPEIKETFAKMVKSFTQEQIDKASIRAQELQNQCLAKIKATEGD